MSLDIGIAGLLVLGALGVITSSRNGLIKFIGWLVFFIGVIAIVAQL